MTASKSSGFPRCITVGFLEAMRAEGVTVTDKAKSFTELTLNVGLAQTPYPHQTEALTAWKQAGRRGVVVLPTGAGKTYVAQLAMEATPRSTLILVPTLDLMHQWYAHLTAAFSGRRSRAARWRLERPHADSGLNL